MQHDKCTCVHSWKTASSLYIYIYMYSLFLCCTSLFAQTGSNTTAVVAVYMKPLASFRHWAYSLSLPSFPEKKHKKTYKEKEGPLVETQQHTVRLSVFIGNHGWGRLRTNGPKECGNPLSQKSGTESAGHNILSLSKSILYPSFTNQLNWSRIWTY